MRTLQIAGATLNQTPIDWENNQSNILAAIQDARQQGVNLLCLPELSITGYGCQDLFLSTWIHQKAFSILLEILPHCQHITVAIGLPVLMEGKAYNCCAMVKDGVILGISAKQHLANDGVHYEPRWFTPWPPELKKQIELEGKIYEIGDITYDIQGVKVGFEICEDAWTVNRPACRLYEKNIELIINPSASHFAFEKTIDREELVVDSSKKFNCAYLYANLLGNEAGRMIYDGEIFISQYGHLIARNENLSFSPYQMVSAIINFDQPDLRVQSVHSRLSKNESFEKATALALYDYLRKSRSKGFVLSLSGGADSACCAVLVASMVKYGLKTLGAELFLNKIGHSALVSELPDHNIKAYIVGKILTCVYQATENSSEITRNAAKALAESIGSTFHEWSIQEEVVSYTEKIEKALDRKLTWERDDIALQNIQARARSPIIWMLANIHHSLLLTTSNRSEGDVGYTTMDGDTSGSIAPIAAVDKPFIRQWLKWAQTSLAYHGLEQVNAQAPTAELRPSGDHQTDEDDLMPYDIMVAIERLAIGKYKSPLEVYQTIQALQLESDELLKQHIAKFYRLWSINQWKRERLAPSFHLDDFNVDPKTWCRFPILSGSYQKEIETMLKE